VSHSNPTRLSPARLALIYVIASGLWVFISSNLVLFELKTPEAITRWEVAKGIAFSLATGALIYWVTGRLVRRLWKSHESLQKSEDRAKRLEQQLMRSRKLEALGQLAGGVAHDFNNVMNVIISNVQLLEHEIGAGELPRLKAIRQAAEQAVALNRQLFTFSRRQQLHPKALNLNALVHQSSSLLQSLVGSQVELVFNLETNVWEVMADPDQMAQVLMNLCVNARDAMPRGGTITIQTRNVVVSEDLAAELMEGSAGPSVLLSVKDSGSGIPPHVQDRMFEPFFTTKAPGKGTGFGLSIVFGVVKQSGGFIEVQTEAGKGAEFLIYFPRVAHSAETSNVETASKGTN
jgi:signal transduction histidine kinase